MKIDPHSIHTGVGALGLIAVCLAPWRVRLLRIFAISLTVLVFFEWICLATGFDWLVWLWWLVHFPSAIALGVDEILERHGPVVSTAFHLGDLLFWSVIATAVVWWRDRRHILEHTTA